MQAIRAISASASAPPGQGADNLAAGIAISLAAIVAVAFGVRWALRNWNIPAGRARAVPAVVVVVVIAVGAPVVVARVLRGTPSRPQSSQALESKSSQGLQTNPYLDPGTPLSGRAPDFTLGDQFGQPVSLHSFRGKVVLLSFTDSECTTICPLTTTAMLEARAMLGRAGNEVQLLGINANPTATAVKDVWAYSDLHGMLRSWHFLTGSVRRLERVWHAYAVESQITHGQIDHTPALFVIGPAGQRAKVYITQQSYASVGQLGQLLAQEASALLPGHPRVHSHFGYKAVAVTSPASSVALPRAGGGTVSLKPEPTAHLYVFFATWDRQVTGLAGGLTGLNRYVATAAGSGLPPLTAVDEGSVEPDTAALSGFLRALPHGLSFPVAVDQTGTVADGYEVLDLPWFVLISSTGHILFYWDVSTAGWPSAPRLEREVRAALARAPQPATTGSALAQELAGSPAPLAALHRQASRLLAGAPALMARVRALRGYPIVINAWASWCGPCRTEFPLLASASAAYGRKVAFLGADINDSASGAASFLAQHPVSYPSYEVAGTDLDPLAVLEGTPTTIFINSAGKVTWVHTGQYFAQGTLDQDIATYALGR